MRKKLTDRKPTEPSDSLPPNLRQAVYIAATILRRIGGCGLDKAETCANVGEVPVSNGGSHEH